MTRNSQTSGPQDGPTADGAAPGQPGLQDRLVAFFGRLLTLAGDQVSEARRLRILRLYLMIHAPFELLWDCLIWETERAHQGLLFASGLVACLALSFIGERTQLAVRLFVGFQLATILWLFPAVSNHFFLVFSCLLLLSLLDLRRPDDALMGLQACRWLALIVLFYSGLQKVLYGTYFQGQLLAWTIAHDGRFQAAFGHIVPADEMARLQGLANTAGPFVAEWWPLIAISNFTYLFELAAPILLLYPRTRSAAVGATFVFLLLIETGAREYFFGCVFVNLLFLFARRNWYPMLLPATFLIYAWRLWPRLDRVWEWF
ncbi:MAG: hypothetical protein AAF657_04240 [Acidobacteriota bacterium]